jgi:BMFP domain-containing protein YqiC
MEETKPKIPDWKTILAGSGVAMALYTIAPFKEFFFTREEGQGIQKQVEENKREIKGVKTQIVNLQEKVTKKIVDLEDELEGQIRESQKEVERTIRDEMRNGFESFTKRSTQIDDRIIDMIKRENSEVKDQLKSIENRVQRIENHKFKGN